MKVSDATTYCIHYHKINFRPNTLANYKFLLGKFGNSYQDRCIDSIMVEEIISFLAGITECRKQNTKRTSTVSQKFRHVFWQFMVRTCALLYSYSLN